MRETITAIGHLALEGTYSYGTNNLRVTDLSGAPPLERNFGKRVQHIDGDLLYYLAGPGGMRPFAAFGAGIARLSPRDGARVAASIGRFITGPASLTAGNKFDFNYSFGVENKVASHLGVRFDLRDHVMGVPRQGGRPGRRRPAPISIRCPGSCTT